MKRARHTAFALAIVGAVLTGGMPHARAVITEPSPAVVLAPTPAADRGHTVSGTYVPRGGSRRDVRVTPALRELRVGSQVVSRGYCIELAYPITPGSSYRETDWGSYGPFAEDPARGERIVGILEQGYPRHPLSLLGQAAGVRSLTRREAITATQVAVWQVSDRFDLRDLPGAGDETEARVRRVVTYLLSQPARPAPPTPRVTVTGPTSGEGGDRLGPYRVEASHGPVRLTLRSAAPVRIVVGDTVLAGRDIDVAPGAQFWLLLPSTGGTADLSASVTTEPLPVGRVFTQRAPDGSPRQSLISVGSPTRHPVSFSHRLSWTADTPLSMGTSVADAADGDRTVGSQGGEVIDTVSLSGLDSGTSYEVRGQLVIDEGGTARPVGMPVSMTFTAVGRTASVPMRLPVGSELAGQRVVVFEQLLKGGKVVARHEDLRALSQTFVVELPPPPPPTPTTSPSSTPTATVTPSPTTVTSTTGSDTTNSETPTATVTSPPPSTSTLVETRTQAPPSGTTAVPTPTSVAEESTPSPTLPRTAPSATAPAELAQTGVFSHRTWPLAAGLMLLGGGSILLARPRRQP